MNNYLSVAMFQLSIQCDCDSQKEYLIETDEAIQQIEKAFTFILTYKPDIALFPEMTYLEKFDEKYLKLSEGRIIVAGSYYKNGINTTVVFQDGKKFEIPKGYASGAEPMARKITFVAPEEFIKNSLREHEFWINGKKIYILNCMEYYHAAYYIARNQTLQKDLFGIFAICSNSNTHVFEEESICIHNHVEGIYTFVLNAISRYQNEPYADGQSYIYGPISIHEKDWLVSEGINSKRNVCHILSLEKTIPQTMYGKFVYSENLSRFGRSDKYLNNPRDITILN